MRQLFTLLFLIIYTVSQSQEVITIKHEPEQIVPNCFYIQDVIDARKDTSNIGELKTSLIFGNEEIKISGGVETAIKDYLQFICPVDSNKTPVVVKILELNISENNPTLYGADLRVININLEFYKVSGDELGKIYEIVATEKETMYNPAKDIEIEIRGMLVKSFVEFNKCEWENIQPKYRKRELVAKRKTRQTDRKVEPVTIEPTPWVEIFSINRTLGFNTNAWGTSAFMFKDKPGKGWIFPVGLSIDGFQIDTNRLNKLNIEPVQMYYVMTGCSPLKEISEDIYLNLELMAGGGFENYINSKDESIFSPVFGISGSQALMYIPDSKIGLFLGLRVEETVLTSKLLPWEVALKLQAGIKF